MPRMPKPRRHGQWWVTEAGGRLHQLCPADRTFEQARDALADHLAQLKREREGGIVEVAGGLTVAHLVDEFLEFKRATKSERTVQYYVDCLAGRFLDWYGDRDPRRLKLSDGTEYLRRLRGEETIKSNATINRHTQAAKAVFNHAVDNERLLKNPWRKLAKLPEKGRQRVMTDDEFLQLLTACDDCIAYRGVISAEDNAQTMRDILNLMRYTALRPGELRKLEWEHLHLDKGLIIMTEHKTTDTARDPEPRIIPVLEEAKAILEVRRQKWGHQPRVFANIYGAEWSDKVFSKRFSRLRERAGLNAPDENGERLTWYHLRHARLTEAGTVEGWNFYELMAYAGHSTPSMTKKYVHARAEGLIRAARKGAETRLNKPETAPSGSATT